jgi:tetratricopeptide (TPR) repeat protein
MEAANAFQKAAYLDPNNPAATLYLGAAYMSAWLKDGASSSDSAVQAEEQLRRVLILQPENDKALLWLAWLMLRQQRLDEAEFIYSKATALVHNERAVCDANYAMGIIIWSRWYARYSAARHKLGVAESDSGLLPDSGLRKELRDRYKPLIDEGIYHFRSVLSEKSYGKAAAYLSLLYRERATVSEDTRAKRTQCRTRPRAATRRKHASLIPNRRFPNPQNDPKTKPSPAPCGGASPGAAPRRQSSPLARPPKSSPRPAAGMRPPA